jgi:zinc D-Ala-D-Ala carboxypeptidase
MNKKFKHISLILLTLGLLAALATYGLLYTNNKNSRQNTVPEPFSLPAKKHTTLKEFTPETFKSLYSTYIFPNTQKISENTPITGNETTDSRIRSIAKTRGYTIRSAPIVDSFRVIDSDGHQLQQKAYNDFIDMEQAAKNAGHPIKVVAAYRSAEDQRMIFTERLGSTNPSDAQIERTLTTTAPPGYSRHHTGYTIDLTCVGHESQLFHLTPCFAWLSEKNYENTKRYGWIPSYPEGTEQQGPEPEAWEYVWVGKDATYTD